MREPKIHTLMDSNSLSQAAQILTDAKVQVLGLLNPNDHGLTRVKVESGLNQLINSLSFLGGKQSPVANTSVADQFPPITEFMGEKLVRADEVKPEDINPTEFRKQEFLGKVEDLESRFDDLEDQHLIDYYSSVENQPVLRGVAKRAGVADFKDHDIDQEFIDQIREKRAESSSKEAEVKDLDAKLPKKEPKPAPPVEVPEGTFKDEDKAK